MKASDVTISVNNRAFVQHFTFDQEDGLPEGYTLHLEHTDKPQDPPQGTVYKNGDWGCWGPAAEKLSHLMVLFIVILLRQQKKLIKVNLQYLVICQVELKIQVGSM